MSCRYIFDGADSCESALLMPGDMQLGYNSCMEYSQARIDSKRRDGINVTLWGALANILLSLVKFAAGIVGHSQAMVADGAHSLSDLGSDLVVLGGMRLGARPEDQTHRYGHGKIEALAAMILAGILALAGLVIGYSAVKSGLAIAKGICPRTPGALALVAAIASILVKEGLFRWTREVARRTRSNVLLANAFHHRTDALSSIATLAGVGGAMLFGGRGRILDPLAALVVSAMILVAAIAIMRRSVGELLDAAVEPEAEAEILRIIRGVEGARNPHQLRTRRVGPRVVIDLHLDVDPRLSLPAAHEISHHVESRLRDAFGADTIIYIHVEPGIAYPAENSDHS